MQLHVRYLSSEKDNNVPRLRFQFSFVVFSLKSMSWTKVLLLTFSASRAVSWMKGELPKISLPPSFSALRACMLVLLVTRSKPHGGSPLQLQSNDKFASAELCVSINFVSVLTLMQ